MPAIHFCGMDHSVKPLTNHILMFEDLGPSLTDFVRASKDPISLKTVLGIAVQLIGNIRKVHG